MRLRGLSTACETSRMANASQSGTDRHESCALFEVTTTLEIQISFKYLGLCTRLRNYWIRELSVTVAVWTA
jgi:hypothetical protein